MERFQYPAPGWERLASHILDLVFEKLDSTKDCLQFGTVCFEWHSIFKHNQIEKIRKLHHGHGQIPMLLIPDEEPATWSICNAMDNKFLTTKVSIPYVRRRSGCSNGWLLVIFEDLSVSLYRPFSMVKDLDFQIFHIPRLNLFDDGQLLQGSVLQRVVKVLITLDPLENPDEYDVVFIRDEEDMVTMRPGVDSTWRVIDIDVDPYPTLLSVGGIVDIIYHKSKLYAIDHKGSLLSYDLANRSDDSMIELVALGVQPKYDGITSRYLVESDDGGLWHVERRMPHSHLRVMMRWFRIFRFDFDAKRWVQLESMGNRTLFLGHDSAVCVNALEFEGCLPNCIYFAFKLNYYPQPRADYDVPCQDVGVYHVETNNLEYHLNLDSTILSNMTHFRLPIWVVPNFSAYKSS